MIHHLGLLKKMISEPTDDKNFRICFVVLEDYKGILYILKAFKIFLDNHKTGHIYLCGELKAKLKKYVNRKIYLIIPLFECSNDIVNKTIIVMY